MKRIKIDGNTINAGEVYLVDYSYKLKSLLLHHVTGAITILPVNKNGDRVDIRSLESL